MRSKIFSPINALLAIFAATPFGSSTLAVAQHETVLYSFENDRYADGSGSTAALTLDGSGSLYGTTTGAHINYQSHATVFKLTREAGGAWQEKTLSLFSDGEFYGAGVIFDTAGNLYGTTYDLGTHGYGSVFELMPQPSGYWTEKTLHSFDSNGTDAVRPDAGLIFDPAGNLYGETLRVAHTVLARYSSCHLKPEDFGANRFYTASASPVVPHSAWTCKAD